MSGTTTATASNGFIPPFLRDLRVLQALGQIVFTVAIIAIVSSIISSIFASLAAKNLAPTFAFLDNRAGFDISIAPAWYSSDSRYVDAFLVGVTNTLRVVSVGLILTTILGVFVGIFLLSSNWLIRSIARIYVELLRNTPLLVQLFIWYFIVMISGLPDFRQAITFPPEGVIPIPVRFLGYIVIYGLSRRHYRNRSSDAPARVLVLNGLIAVMVAAEIGFRLTFTQPAWKAVYGSGSLTNGGFLVYAAVSIVLIAVAWFAPRSLRWRGLAWAVGQFVGGLLFYFGILPQTALKLEMYPAVFISVRGFVFPEIVSTARFAEWMAFVGIGLALALVIQVYYGRLTETTGKPYPRWRYALGVLALFAILGWIIVGSEPAPTAIPVQVDGAEVMMPLDEARVQGLLTRDDERLYAVQPLLATLPQQKINKAGIVTGLLSGTEIQPEYMALLLGLAVYTSSFIAEIVRAGILAVPRGQIEAARALGLTTPQVLGQVILPQALRVIIPPLGNQYLNLSKNSSLAITIAYADVVFVTQTIMNQSGQSVTGITMLMMVYLTISLTISAGINFFNRRFQLVTR